MKMLVRCGVCEWQGIINNLAEYLPDQGILSIRRSKGLIPGQTTIVIGNDYQILCGNCKEIAFKKIPILIQQTKHLDFFYHKK